MTISKAVAIASIAALTAFAAPASAQEYPCNGNTHAQGVARNFMKEIAVSPSTVEFVNWIDKIYFDGKKTFHVFGEMDSQNVFGAIVRTEYGVQLECNGSTWQDLNVTNYAAETRR